MKTTKKILQHSPILALLLASAMLGGCGDNAASESVGGGLLVDKSTSSLTAGDLLSISGTYGANCVNRSGDWSLGVGGAYIEHSVLSVVKDDESCELTVTEVRAGVDEGDVYVADSPSVLTDAYSVAATSFSFEGLGPVIFYANSMLSSTAFAGNFTLSVLYSDDPELASASRAASYVVVSSTFSEDALLSPDYTVNMTGLSLQVDANQIVENAAGTAQLFDGIVVGQSYVVESGALGATPTYAQIDAAYVAGSQFAISTADPTIDASRFGLTGSDLTSTQVRNVIVANTAEGLNSYQVFRVTFNPAVN